MINYNKPAAQLVWDQINRDNPQLKKPCNLYYLQQTRTKILHSAIRLLRCVSRENDGM